MKLKREILNSCSKFASILSKESYQKLVENMFEQYFRLENIYLILFKIYMMIFFV